jgi:hypothetical protein
MDKIRKEKLKEGRTHMVAAEKACVSTPKRIAYGQYRLLAPYHP